MDDHGKKHRFNWCDTCNTYVNLKDSTIKWNHVTSTMHLQNAVREKGSDPIMIPKAFWESGESEDEGNSEELFIPIDGINWCEACQTKVNLENDDVRESHETGRKHLRKTGKPKTNPRRNNRRGRSRRRNSWGNFNYGGGSETTLGSSSKTTGTSYAYRYIDLEVPLLAKELLRKSEKKYDEIYVMVYLCSETLAGKICDECVAVETCTECKWAKKCKHLFEKLLDVTHAALFSTESTDKRMRIIKEKYDHQMMQSLVVFCLKQKVLLKEHEVEDLMSLEENVFIHLIFLLMITIENEKFKTFNERQQKIRQIMMQYYNRQGYSTFIAKDGSVDFEYDDDEEEEEESTPKEDLEWTAK